MTLPPSGYFTDPNRTNGEAKQGQDDMRDAIADIRGARVRLNADQSIPNAMDTIASWNVVNFDTDAIFDSDSPTRLTVPEGVSWVELTAGAVWQGGLINVPVWVVVLKNGITQTAMDRRNAIGFGEATISTGPLAVSGGDFFQLVIRQDSGVSILFYNSTATFFTMRILG